MSATEAYAGSVRAVGQAGRACSATGLDATTLARDCAEGNRRPHLALRRQKATAASRSPCTPAGQSVAFGRASPVCCGTRHLYMHGVYCTVRFVWDPDKNAANVAKRGIAFSEAARVFDGPTLERYDGSKDYGEDRYIAVGLAEGRALVVV